MFSLQGPQAVLSQTACAEIQKCCCVHCSALAFKFPIWGPLSCRLAGPGGGGGGRRSQGLWEPPASPSQGLRAPALTAASRWGDADPPPLWNAQKLLVPDDIIRISGL